MGIRPLFRDVLGERGLVKSIHSTLIVLMLAALLPLTMLKVAGIYTRYDSYTDQELRASQELAEATGAAFVNFLSALWNSLWKVGVAISGQHSGMSSLEAGALMDSVLGLHSAVEHLYWLNPDGTVISATDSSQGSLPLSDLTVVEMAQHGKKEAVSNLLIDQNTGLPTIAVARGIEWEGELQGIVVATVRLSDLYSVLPMRSSENRTLGLVDAQELIVYRNTDPQLPWEKRRLREEAPARQTLLTGKAVISKKFPASADETVRMGAVVPIPEIGWAAYASAPVDDVLAGAQAITRQETIGLLIAILLALGAARWVGNGILARVSVLRGAARALSEGELTTRTNLQGEDELSLAGQTFDRMAERIQRLEAQRSQFLRVAAHELRNPMASIKGLLALMQRRMSHQKAPGDLNQLAQILEREIDRLANLLNDVLEAFRVQEGQLGSRWEPVELGEVVRQALTPFQAMGERQWQLQIADDAEETLWINGDASRLEDVLRNLFSNAVKYSPEASRITISLRREGERALVAVRNEGRGIADSELERIFDPFFRSADNAPRDPGGMGLGLYICREVVRAHEGRIWAENDPTSNAGVTFFVDMPLRSAADSVPHLPAGVEANSFSPLPERGT